LKVQKEHYSKKTRGNEGVLLAHANGLSRGREALERGKTQPISRERPSGSYKKKKNITVFQRSYGGEALTGKGRRST